MKTKTFAFLFILFFISVSAYAQKGLWLELNVEGKSAMGGEFQVPTDLFTVASWTNMPKKFTLKGSIGADLCYYFSDYMGLSLGLHYSGSGQDYDDYIWSFPGGSVNAERTVSIHYLQLPLQVRYINAPSQKISFILAAGFYTGFLLNYEVETKYLISSGATLTAYATGNTYSITTHDNTGTDSVSVMLASEPFDANDFGAVLSAGFQIRLNDKVSLPVMLKYETGFGNVKNKSSYYTYQGDSYLYWEDDYPGSPNLNLNHINSAIGLKIGLRLAL